MMSIFTHSLVFERGARAGRRLPFTPPQMTLGRASESDIAIPDPLLSRAHCRFEMRDGYLWVVDLDSANETLVNDVPVKEQRLMFGDFVAVGDSVIRIDHAETAAPLVPAPVADEPAATPTDVVIDLGFDKPDDDAQPKKNLLRPLIWLVAAILILGVGITIIQNSTSQPTGNTITPLKQDNTLLVYYEKVEASTENIFRYELTLTADGMVAVKLDDLTGSQRHIEKEQEVATELLADLARDLEGSGFFTLNKTYTGFALNPNTLNESQITIAIGKKIHTCRLTNRSDEPDGFRAAREKLEVFTKNELGLWDINLSAEKLTELAEESLEVARKRYIERDVKYGNLFEALRNYRDAISYLDTVNPKPEFYAEVIDGFDTVKEDLRVRYEDRRFQANRASNVNDWPTAARELKIICEMIPDRNDPRHKEATQKLIDVENRLRPR